MHTVERMPRPQYYNLLDILKFDNIFRLKVALFAHNIINDLTGIATIFSGTLPLASDCHSHYTRFGSNLNFHRPQINNNHGSSTFSFIASKIWETIPLEFKKQCYYRFSKHFKLYISAYFAICFLEYIDLVYFRLTTFSHVLLLFFRCFGLCFIFIFCLIHVNTVTLAPFLFLYNYFSLLLLSMPASLTWQ